MIRENIIDFLDRIDKEDVKKEYLTHDELKQLANTPCDKPVLKQASLFSCLTGLRISDILNLEWEDLVIAPDQGYCIRIRTIKTKAEASLPISNEAIELCGERSTGKVFKGLKRSMTNYPLKKWVTVAGITKPITFFSSHLCNLTDCFWYRYLYCIKDAYPSQCINYTNLCRPCQRKEARDGQ